MDLKFLLEFKGLKRIHAIEEDPEVMEGSWGILLLFAQCACTLQDRNYNWSTLLYQVYIILLPHHYSRAWYLIMILVELPSVVRRI